MLRRSSFVTCNRGKTSNGDDDDRRRIPSTGTKSLSRVAASLGGLALTFVKTVKERPVFPRRVFERATAMARGSQRKGTATESRRTKAQPRSPSLKVARELDRKREGAGEGAEALSRIPQRNPAEIASPTNTGRKSPRRIRYLGTNALRDEC